MQGRFGLAGAGATRERDRGLWRTIMTTLPLTSPSLSQSREVAASAPGCACRIEISSPSWSRYSPAQLTSGSVAVAAVAAANGVAAAGSKAAVSSRWDATDDATAAPEGAPPAPKPPPAAAMCATLAVLLQTTPLLQRIASGERVPCRPSISTAAPCTAPWLTNSIDDAVSTSPSRRTSICSLLGAFGWVGSVWERASGVVGPWSVGRSVCVCACVCVCVCGCGCVQVVRSLPAGVRVEAIPGLCDCSALAERGCDGSRERE